MEEGCCLHGMLDGILCDQRLRGSEYKRIRKRRGLLPSHATSPECLVGLLLAETDHLWS